MRHPKNLRHEDAAMIWGFALFCGGTKAVRGGITPQAVISFAGALLLGFMVWAVFKAASMAFENESPGKRWLYELIFLLVITFLSTGTPWR